MTDEKQELKIEFAPGCFDNFEGTQEELDELMRELKDMFANKSKEEIEFMSRPMTEEDFAELPEAVQESLASAVLGEVIDPKRNLQ